MGDPLASKKRYPAEMDELTAFLGFFFDRYMANGSARSEIHPLNVLRNMAERAPKRALLGLRMAINDIVEMTGPWTTEQVKEADTVLRAQSIITLSELRRRYSRQFAAVLKRGRISNEPEYYLVRGILSDGAVTAEQAALLEILTREFETRRA